MMVERSVATVVVGCCGWNVSLWSERARWDWKNRRGLDKHLW